MNKMYLVLGDWSGDGHGISEKVLIESNVSVQEIQEAYKASCKLTGVSFNHNNDYTGIKRNYEEALKYHACTEYQNDLFTSETVAILKNHGLSDNFLNKLALVEDDGSNGYYLYQDKYIKLWIWFVKLSLPSIAILEQVEDEIPVINGYWDKNLNVQFGYGLYGQ